MKRSSIRARLIASFSVTILIPSLTALFIGVWMIRRQVLAQAQARVTSDLEAAKEIYSSTLERLQVSLRIHATRRAIYGFGAGGDTAAFAEEMERVRRSEGLDVLTLVDTRGRVVHRTRNPAASGDSLADDVYVRRALHDRQPVAGAAIVTRAELELCSPELERQAFMELTPTPMAAPGGPTRLGDGLMLRGAAPVVTADGRLVGALIGGVLINRNYAVVDRIRKTVFKQELYRGREVGTATIFQGDVRVSTNVMNHDGSRAIATRASAEVADAVLRRGETWLGRAFVVHDWYLAAYAPIRDLGGSTIGMLYVGTLERPYVDVMRHYLYVLLGITFLGVVLVSVVAGTVAQRISRPVRAMAAAAQQVAAGDYSQKVSAESRDEIGELAARFNAMTVDLGRAHQELREWGENLERKVEQRTAELKAMQAHMLQAEKLAAIGKLAAGVAHEINNPLTGVLTNASLLLADLQDSDPRREDLQVIVDETMRCRKIVKGLLEFSRQTRPQKQALSINTVAEDVLSLVRNQASFRNIAIDTELDPDVPAVMADRDQLRQVVLNIVLNAAEAMGPTGTLRIVTRRDAAADQVVIEIHDTGPGIPEEIRDRLFEPFFTTKKTGTGLGLSIVYGIVEQHRGEVRVDSRSGEGTTFTITLPCDA